MVVVVHWKGAACQVERRTDTEENGTAGDDVSRDAEAVMTDVQEA